MFTGPAQRCSSSCLFAYVAKRGLQQSHLEKVIGERNEAGLLKARSG